MLPWWPFPYSELSHPGTYYCIWPSPALSQSSHINKFQHFITKVRYCTRDIINDSMICSYAEAKRINKVFSKKITIFVKQNIINSNTTITRLVSTRCCCTAQWFMHSWKRFDRKSIKRCRQTLRKRTTTSISSD